MTDSDYQRFFKFFGKLCYSYDSVSTDTRGQQISRAWEQIAQTGYEFSNQPTQVTFAQYVAKWQGIIGAQNEALHDLLISAATAQLIDPKVACPCEVMMLSTKSFDRDKTNVIVVIQAFIAELTADGKSLTPGSSVGLVNFFADVVAAKGPIPVTFPTSVSPTFPDSTYVTFSVVP